MTTCIVFAIDWTNRGSGFPTGDLDGVVEIKICQRDCPDPFISFVGPTSVTVQDTGQPIPVDFGNPWRVLAMTVGGPAAGVKRLAWYPDLERQFDFVKIVE